jgi:hypothetical protein
VKTIYSGFSLPFWLEVADKLSSDSGWQPVYWIARSNLENAVKERFPVVEFHSVVDAVKGIRPPGYAEEKTQPVDPILLEEFSEIQLTALKMMDRIDALGSFDYHARIRLYYRQLMYWKTVLDELQPDGVVFSNIPHLVFDYLLFELCKRKDIRTAMFESTPMRGLVFVMETYDGPSRASSLYHQWLEEGNIENVALKPETRAYMHALQGSYQDAPEYIRRAYKEEIFFRKRSTTAIDKLKKLLRFGDYGRYVAKQRAILEPKLGHPDSYVKQKGKKLEDSSMSRLDVSLFRYRSRRRMRKLEAYYQRLAVEVDLEQPFIYVALSFQPERTTSPMGGVFANQYLMVDMVSKTVPEGWSVYVKEHPTQYLPAKLFRSQSGRTFDLYDDIVALPNVELASMTVSSYDLIDRAQAVATVTGTVGWEAVLRGKPILIFGNPWYRGGEGMFQIDSLVSCQQAMEQLTAGYEIDPKRLELFVYALEQTGLEAYVEKHLRVLDISDEENAVRIAKALQQIWS